MRHIDPDLDPGLRSFIERAVAQIAVPERAPVGTGRRTALLASLSGALVVVVIVAAAVAAGQALTAMRQAAATPSQTPATTSVAASAPLLRIRVPAEYKLFDVSPDGRYAAAQRSDGLGLTLFKIQAPLVGSDAAQLVEVARLNSFVGGALWLPDSLAVLVEAVFDPSVPAQDKPPYRVPPRPRELTLMDVSGKVQRTGLQVNDLSVVRPGSCFLPCVVNLSPDGKWIPFVDASARLVELSRDGSTTRVIAAAAEHSNLGWDVAGNLLVARRSDAGIDALRSDGSVAYTIGAPASAAGLRPGFLTQSPDSAAAVVEFGMMGSPSQRFLLIDRTFRPWPADLTPYHNWIGSELLVMRTSDQRVLAYAPAKDTTRDLGVAIPSGGRVWGVSGDYLAWQDRLVDLRTGRTVTLPAVPVESVIPLRDGLFTVGSGGTQMLLDAKLVSAGTPVRTPLRVASDQAGVPARYVRIEHVDGGWSVVIPQGWTWVASFDDGAEITSFPPGALAADQPLPMNAARIRIRLASKPLAQTLRDYELNLVGGHGNYVISRETVTIAGQQGELLYLYENTLYPRAGTTLNWLVAAPLRQDRIIHVAAWPDGDLRADLDRLVASLRVFAPR